MSQISMASATQYIYERVHRGGHEMKNDLPNRINAVVKCEGWRNITNPATGKPFDNVGDWLISSYPYGPAIGDVRYAISYDELIQLCERRSSVKDLLVKHRPKGKRGGDRRSEEARIKHDNIIDDKSGYKKLGTSRAYIEDRLCRDFPEIWKAYLKGEYRSARAAAIAAGFIKDTHDPVLRLKSNWRKASKKQRKEFIAWLADEFGIQMQ